MDFGKALEALKNGCKVKLPTWAGYWVKEGDTVKMYCKNGEVLDIRETQDVFYTLGNIASDEWEVVGECPHDLNIKTFRFGEALRQLKAGKKVARKGWNGKGMFLLLATEIDFTTPADLACCQHLEGELISPSIVMKTADDHFVVGWLASQTDMLAEDWVLVD